MNFHLSHDWTADLLRDVLANLEDGALADMVEELLPFTSDQTRNLTTIINDEELKKTGLWTDKTLLERYRDGQKKFPETKFKA